MYWLYIFAFTGLVALLFLALLWPLIKEQSARSKKLLLALVVAIPLVSLVIYQQRGAMDEVLLLTDLQMIASDTSGTTEDVNAGVLDKLEAYLESNPEDAEYWFLLGEMQMDMQDFEAALNAFAQASELRPEDISLYSRMAEARFFMDGYSLSQEVRNYIDVVLAENPNDTTVMGILGISAYRAQQFEAAVRFWERALQNLPPFSPAAQSIQSSIEQAKIAGNLTSGEGAPDQNNNANSSPVSLNLVVSLDEGIEVTPEDAVFVFARQYNGGPMPIVAQRLTAGALPAQVVLDDSSLMVQGRSLADFEQLELVARLSFSGSPAPQPGDYQVLLGPINPLETDQPIRLEIADLIE
jgi:cytochrome c-type biogenesis protein CcmH